MKKEFDANSVYVIGICILVIDLQKVIVLIHLKRFYLLKELLHTMKALCLSREINIIFHLHAYGKKELVGVKQKTWSVHFIHSFCTTAIPKS